MVVAPLPGDHAAIQGEKSAPSLHNVASKFALKTLTVAELQCPLPFLVIIDESTLVIDPELLSSIEIGIV